MPLQRKVVERRSHHRVKKTLPIKIKNDSFDIVTETKNISCIGAYCLVDKYIAPFTKVETAILLPHKIKNKPQHVNCKGTVVRVEKDNSALENNYSIAIYFNEISKANMSKINRFVESQP